MGAGCRHDGDADGGLAGGAGPPADDPGTAEGRGGSASGCRGGAGQRRQGQGGGDKHRKLNLQLLDKPKKFEHALPEDEDREFPEWQFTFEAWIAAHDRDMGDEMPWAAAHPQPLPLTDMDGAKQVRSFELYGVLMTLFTGRLRKLVRNVADNNGYEAWRQVGNMMLPKDRNRSLGCYSG